MSRDEDGGPNRAGQLSNTADTVYNAQNIAVDATASVSGRNSKPMAVATSSASGADAIGETHMQGMVHGLSTSHKGAKRTTAKPASSSIFEHIEVPSVDRAICNRSDARRAYGIDFDAFAVVANGHEQRTCR